MPLQIPIQPVPSQILLVSLGGQNVQVAIYLKSTGLYVDINVNGVDMSVGIIALNAVPLDSANSYDGFQGNLFLVDTQGSDDPLYTGLGSRWQLVYLTAAEIAVLPQGGIPVTGNLVVPAMTLSASLNVTASEPGNFTVPHGLGVTPFLIEIIPTTNGGLWGQATFADATNLYLVSTDTGVTATVLIYEQTVAGLQVVTPAKTLLVSSPNFGNFTVAHGLGEKPSFIEILPTSFGFIWETAVPDATNLYLGASDEGVTVKISLYPAVTGAVNLVGPAVITNVTTSAPGLFQFAHGLLSTPTRIEILMLSSGAIIAQTPNFDATNVYLDASDAGLIGKVLVYL